MTYLNKWIVAGAVIIGFATVGLVSVLSQGSWSGEFSDSDGAGSETATTSAEGAATSTAVYPVPKKTLPPEQPFVLPEGATSIDEYAFSKDGDVYFKSLTGKQPLRIPDADGATFRRQGNFLTYLADGVVRDCGVSPLLAYYTDKNRVYFYQVWRAPEFRSSTVEVIIDADPKTFTVVDALNAKDDTYLFRPSYAQATSTCSLVLGRARQ